MPSFFYTCKKCGEFKEFTETKRSGGNESPPSEKQRKMMAFAKCPKCKSKVPLKDYLPKKGNMLFRMQISGGPHHGKHLTRMI